MQKRLTLIFALVAACLLVGCQPAVDNAPVDTSAKPDVGSEETKGQKRMNEDFSVIPAPEGVKTGTPGPSGK